MPQFLASSKALVSPVLEAALRLTHLGWSRVSVGPDEGGQDDDDDGAAEGGREGREGRTGHRAASSPLTASCFACCRRRLGLVQGDLTRRLCCSSCGSARCKALRHCRHGSDLVGHLLSRRASSAYPLHVQVQPPSTSSPYPLHILSRRLLGLLGRQGAAGYGAAGAAGAGVGHRPSPCRRAAGSRRPPRPHSAQRDQPTRAASLLLSRCVAPLLPVAEADSEDDEYY